LDVEKTSYGAFDNLLGFIEAARMGQLAELGLGAEVTAKQAISDLEANGSLSPCTDEESPKGFWTPAYKGPKTNYQKLMHKDFTGAMNSTRLARHSKEVQARFKKIIASCRQGVRMNEKDRTRFGLLKHRIHPMAPDRAAPTITTLPDDVLHYCEPRILSVRESARIQSFPDWFKFLGKYTTGGDSRRRDCPRYTQVGNAVPPLFARALGVALSRLLRTVRDGQPAAARSVHPKDRQTLIEA
jgi:DNA (cytosine-5)-methyltransferase 1